jgi:poly-gamma-glutamate synthesis protein (capsule biosynthesis protein)
MKNARFTRWTLIPAVLVLGCALAATVDVATQQPAAVQRDFTKELANKMRGSYVVAAVGGILMQEPVGRQASPAIQRLLREAHTAIGSLEFYQTDRPSAAPLARDLAKDLTELGFDLVGVDETQGGEASFRATSEALTQMGVPIAQLDRQAIFQYLASGRTALINGPNPIRLSTTKYVTAEQLAQLKAIRDSIVARRNDPDVARPIGIPQDLPDRVTIFSDTFVLGPVAGEIREELSAEDRQSSLMAVRYAKQYADFVAFSMPMPPTAKAAHYSTNRRPHDGVVALAHELVDNGMDMYVGRGSHIVQGIEIYKGRPIFYNLGDLSVHRTDPATESATALVATASYQDGILQEVRIYPVDLGSDPLARPASTLGVVMTPSPDTATRILSELQKNSEAFGTRISIEGGVGIIRVPREATVAIGQNIKDFGSAPRAGGAGGGRGGRGGGRGAGRGGV